MAVDLIVAVISPETFDCLDVLRALAAGIDIAIEDYEPVLSLATCSRNRRCLI